MSSEPASGTTRPTPTETRRFALGLAAIGFGALLLRVLVIVVGDPRVPRLGDATAYHLIARNLADGRGYIRPFDLLQLGRAVPSAEYPPLHPFVVSVFARLGARSVEAQRVALAVVGSGTVTVVGLLGRRVAGATVGLVAAGIAACSPMLFLPDVTLMSETVYGFLVTVTLLVAVRAFEQPTPQRIVGLGAVLGLTTLARPEALLLALFLLVPIGWRIRGRVTRRIGLPALGFAALVAVVAPWTVRNLTTFDHFVPVSNNFGGVLSGANCPLTYSGADLGSWRSTFGLGGAHAGECFTGFNGREPDFNEAAAGADQRRRGIAYARDHLDRLPVVGIARVLRTFGLFRPAQQIDLGALEGRPRWLEALGTWVEWALYPLAIAGFVILVRRRATVAPLVAAVGTVVVASFLTYGNQRFRIAAEPAILVAAATAVVAAATRNPGPRSKPAPSVE